MWKVIDIGTLFYSRRAKDALDHAEVLEAIRQYEYGDWGDVSARQAAFNEEVLKDEGEVVGHYYSSSGHGFWLITEGGHRATLVRLEDEFGS